MKYFVVTAIKEVVQPKAKGSKKGSGIKEITESLVSSRERCEEFRAEQVELGRKCSVVRRWHPRKR